MGLGDLFGGRRVVLGVREDPVAQRRSPDHARVVGGAGHPDRDRERLGRRLGERDLVVRAVVVEPLAGPDRADDVETFVEHRRPGEQVSLLTEPAEVTGFVRTEPGAEDQAPTGEPADRRRVPGDHPRAAPGGRRDHRPEEQPAGGVRDGAERRPRIRDGHRVRDHVIPQEKAVPARPLRAHGEVDEHPGLTERAERRQIDGVADRAAGQVDHLPNVIVEVPGRPLVYAVHSR